MTRKICLSGVVALLGLGRPSLKSARVCVAFFGQVEINETGTTLRFKPGYVTGGRVSHDCGTTRSLGWFIEGLIPLALFR